MTTIDPARNDSSARASEGDLRDIIAAGLRRWPSAGVAVAVIRDGSPVRYFYHGIADVASGRRVSEGTVFRIGSLTKTVTAVAVMQLCEQGMADLDAPANDYLRGFQLVPASAGFGPATVRHLLTHTAGVGFWRRGSDLLLHPGTGSGVTARAVVPLSEYYRGGLPVDVEPGTRWAYSNHASAAAARRHVVPEAARLAEPAPLGHRHRGRRRRWRRDRAPREGVIAVTIEKTSLGKQAARPGRRATLGLGSLIGSGDRIGAFVLPFVLAGVTLNIVFPGAFGAGGPPLWLQAVSAFVLAVGVVVWAWSVLLILTKVRAGELVTTGPYSLVKHPLYTSVALLVLPWLGFLFDTWLGALLGIALYIASRLFSPAEEADLVGRFGPEWDAYRDHVKVPWL